ncbi:MAG: phosphoribosylformimino-5-aminoimidazole carboxamide ribotide isomerase [Phenylobacterium sp.]|jgi:phosphoribosylformimino-5-aminoimidazole carboxamide ribotide isomerase
MIIPAIDLIGGQTVRLYQGDYNKKTSYDRTPLEISADYAASEAKWLHLVDLDGAKDSSQRQIEVLKALIDQNGDSINIQVGGGVRSEQDVKDLLAIGADRVVIGSLAIKEPEMVQQWLREYGNDKIVLALDINIDEDGNKWLPTHGWIEKSNTRLEDLLDNYQSNSVAVKHVLCTDISKDGTLTGSNVALYHEVVARYPDIQWQASGGIGKLDDIRQLPATGVVGIILGRSLLEGKFTLEEAIACWQNA